MSVTSTTLPAALRAILRTANTRCSASIRKNWASSSSGGRCCWMNVSLPDRGWGVLEFSEIRSAAGREWTDDGQVHEVRRPKGGPRNAVRRVPVPPVLVELLREHIQEFGTAPDGRLFRTYRGATCLPSTLWQVLQKARRQAFSPAQVVSPLARRPYDFRHAGVSWRLNAGTPAPQVAEWAGHTVEVLFRIYAHCIDGDDERSPGWKKLLASLGALYRAWLNAGGGLLTWPDAPGLIPHIFRKLRLRAASGGIWLRMCQRAFRSILPGQSAFGLFTGGCPRQDSNLRSRLRRR